ncbi:response regulator receiver domain protein [Medicago truncatula]|uniref:Response regulator receiver domain protein n=1 Tax=Medicago truncatula TaxID=3880 RepID=A0A072U908_MEDTR|nr:response regulator receiver domain protein [Medicago truncatula]
MALSTEMEALPQQFLEGPRVLVIDHDTTIHNVIVEKSIGWDFKVTTCSNASFALTLLREAKGCFDVILIEEQISDMNSYDFLQQITQQINIPVIMMGKDGSTSAAMKAIANGACEYCVKPLSDDDLIKNICQHVSRKSLNENKHDQIHVDNGTKETHVDVVEKDNYQPPTKKNRLKWSQAMQQEFLRAVNQFGLDNAKPKKIIEVMNVPGLTKEHIASHLQKLRIALKNEMPKGKWKKSKQDQCHHPTETQLGLEAAKSTPELDQNVKNSVIQCDNNSHAPQHSSIFANLFTDQSDVQSSVIQCDNNSYTPQHSQTFANIFTHQSNVQNFVIQCDNNSHAPQHSPPFANIFTAQSSVLNSYAPQHSSTFGNIFTYQSNMNPYDEFFN